MPRRKQASLKTHGLTKLRVDNGGVDYEENGGFYLPGCARYGELHV